MPHKVLSGGLSFVASLFSSNRPWEPIKAIGRLLGKAGETFPWLAPIVSGILAAISFPPFQKGFIAWFALTPLLVTLRRKTMLRAAGSAWLFGWTFAAAAFFWVNSITSVNLISFLLMVMVLSFYFPAFGLFYAFLNRAIGPWMILGAPAIWVVIEYARSNLLFLALPWNLLGHSQYSFVAAIQIADIAGVYGVSFLVVMVNEVLSRIPDALQLQKHKIFDHDYTLNTARIWKSQVAIAALVLAAALAYGFFSLKASKATDHIRIGLVQNGVRARHVAQRSEQESILDTFQTLTRKAAREGPELIIWPASSLPAPITVSRFVRDSVTKLAKETQAYLVVGSATFEKFKPLKQGERPYSNSEFVVSPDGRIDGPYNKVILLPFDEYLPLQGLVEWPVWITPLRQGFLPGDTLKLFEVGPAKFGTPICWENMFPDFFRKFVKRGANLMISVTNEGFMEHSRAQYQSLAINVFRAVENRISVIRASSVGVSAVIDPKGNILDRVHDEARHDLFVSGFIVRDVPLFNSSSLYTHYGDVFAYLMIGVVMVSLLFALHSKRPS